MATKTYHVRLNIEWEPIVFDVATGWAVAQFADVRLAHRAADLLTQFRPRCHETKHRWATTKDGLIDVCIHCGDLRA